MCQAGRWERSAGQARGRRPASLPAAIGGQVSVYRGGSCERPWNCLRGRHPGDMETYGLYYGTSIRIAAIRSDRSTTCAPDGILAKDRIAAACRCLAAGRPRRDRLRDRAEHPHSGNNLRLRVRLYRKHVKHETRRNFQLDLFTPDDGHYEYSAVATNLPLGLSALWAFRLRARGAGEDLRRAQGGPPGSRRSCWAPSSSCTPRTGSSRDCLFGVVDVAGPILEAKDVPGLGHVRDPAGSSSGPSDDEG
jgi:hypothetical protein